jgi:hypothetical protein
MLRHLSRPVSTFFRTPISLPAPSLSSHCFRFGQLQRTMATANTPNYVRNDARSGSKQLTKFYLQNKLLYAPLAEIDPDVQNIIDKETWRQFTGLELIASEVWMSVLAIVLNIFSILLIESHESRDNGSQWVNLDQQVL